jgi:hypothetical protein
MPSTYEVGAVFRITDEASAVLQRIASQFRELNALIDDAKASLSSLASTRLAGLTGRIGKVGEALTSLSAAADKSTGSVVSGLGSIDAAAVASIDSLKALKAQIAEVGATSRASLGGGAPAGIRARGAGAAGGGGGLHFGRMELLRLPGGSSISLPGGPALAAAAAGAFGVYEAGEVEDAIFQLRYHLGLPATTAVHDQLRDIIGNSMSQTGFSLTSVIEAAKTEARMFKGTPGGGLDVMPEMMRAAAVEARLKGTGLEEAMQSFIGLAHMTKQYGPEQIAKLAPAFAFLSASNPSSLGSMERAASYAVPILQSGLDIDPATSLLLGTVLTRAGATNTKSGTWLRNLALNAMPGTSLMSKTAFIKHEDALKALGLVDSSGKPIWFTDGKPDLLKLLGIAGDNAAKIPLTERAAYEKQLFGAQGYGAFALLSDPAVMQQIKSLGAEMNSAEFKNRYASFMQDYSAASPIQQMRQTWADLQNVLIDVGTVALPPVTSFLKDLDQGAKDSARQINTLVSALNSLAGPISAAVGAISGAVKGLFNAGPSIGNPPPGSWPPAPHLPRPTGPLGYYGPPPGGQAVTVHTALNVDGRKLAEATSTHLAELYTHPTQAPYSDSYLGYAAPDYNFATG